MSPTYEYECQACRGCFDKFQGMKDPPLKKCPHCGGNVRRLIGTGAGLLFKGSGFYITDYRSEGYKQSAKADTKPEPAKAAPSTAAEKKPAAKAAKADKAK
jgi:putative FmdB family regulatory protein